MFTKLLAFFAISAAGCASGQTVAGSSSPSPHPDGNAACGRPSIAKPLGAPAENGATLALAKLGTKRVAFVADEDDRAVVAIDIDAKTALATTSLSGVPSQLMVASDGRVLVLLRDRSALQVLVAEDTSGMLIASCTVPTAPEPVALATSPDHRALFVSSGWGRTLRAYDGQTFTHRFDVPLAREPRAVVVADDGRTAFVSHAVGAKISAVDLTSSNHEVRDISMRGADIDTLQVVRAQKKALAKLERERESGASRLASNQLENVREVHRLLERRLRSGTQGFALAKSMAPAGRVLAPQVLVDPGDPEGRPQGYGDNGAETGVPTIAVVDEGTGKAFEPSLTVVRTAQFLGKREGRDQRGECLLPRAAAVDPRSHTLFVACFGIDSVIAYDAASASPQASERRRWTVGSGPTGIAVDPERPQALAWSQFDRTLSFIPLEGPELIEGEEDLVPRLSKVAIGAGASKVPTDVALGRMIFHSAGDTRISKDGRACASCHPDGRDDALTWATPDGPRRSILLAGRVTKTAPYAWDGSSKSLHEHITKTFDRLDGTGLRSLELDSLIAYISSLAPPIPAANMAKDDPKVARGAAIFASKETACASCHTSATGFADGMKHDVMSKAKADKTARFDTPSLRLIGGTGPYFHDGRYADLRTLLRDVDGKMGHTKHLSDADLDALETYLRTL